jgi:hypothetical protein
MRASRLIGRLNVRAPRYLVARTGCACGRCARETPVIGIALPPGHETRIGLSEAAGVPGGGAWARAAGTIWQIEEAPAWLSFIEYLRRGARRRLEALSAGYRRGPSPARDGDYWVNHCAHCGAAQEDDYLHGEPDVAFLPFTAAAAARIEWLPFDEPFGAWAGGYGTDPPPLGSPPRGGVGV